MNNHAKKLKRIMADEQLVLDALAFAYTRGHMSYAHCQQGYDATIARHAALSFLLAEHQPKEAPTFQKENSHAN